MSWLEDAACKGTNLDDWFVGSLVSAPPALAALCRSCPVRTECLEDAVATGDLDYGVRGGLVPSERRAWARDHGLPRHGTLTGYTRDGCHCDLCRTEVAQYTASRRRELADA